MGMRGGWILPCKAGEVSPRSGDGGGGSEFGGSRSPLRQRYALTPPP